MFPAHRNKKLGNIRIRYFVVLEEKGLIYFALACALFLVAAATIEEGHQLKNEDKHDETHFCKDVEWISTYNNRSDQVIVSWFPSSGSKNVWCGLNALTSSLLWTESDEDNIMLKIRNNVADDKICYDNYLYGGRDYRNDSLFIFEGEKCRYAYPEMRDGDTNVYASDLEVRREVNTGVQHHKFVKGMWGNKYSYFKTTTDCNLNGNNITSQPFFVKCLNRNGSKVLDCDLNELTRSMLWGRKGVRVRLTLMNENQFLNKKICFTMYKPIEDERLNTFLYEKEYCEDAYEEQFNKNSSFYVSDFVLSRVVNDGVEYFKFNQIFTNNGTLFSDGIRSDEKENFYSYFRRDDDFLNERVLGKRVQIEWDNCRSDGRRCNPKVSLFEEDVQSMRMNIEVINNETRFFDHYKCFELIYESLKLYKNESAKPIVNCVERNGRKLLECNLKSLTNSQFWCGTDNGFSLKIRNEDQFLSDKICYTDYNIYFHDGNVTDFIFERGYCEIGSLSDDFLLKRVDGNEEISIIFRQVHNRNVSLEDTTLSGEKFYKLDRINLVLSPIHSLIFGRSDKIQWHNCNPDGKRCRPSITSTIY